MITFPNTDTKSLTEWSNYSGTVQDKNGLLFCTPRAVEGLGTAAGAMKPQGEALKAILGHCFDNSLSLRTMGAKWSFSRIIEPKQVILDAPYLNGILRIGQQSQSATYQAERGAKGFVPYWVQGGRTIAMINERLLENGHCLQTSGAGDGHRMGGCLATATHGAALDIGALHDTILGVHLMVAPDRAVFLQRSTSPPLTDTFVTWLQDQTGIPTENLQDDTLFRAGLVSLGSLGFLFSVVLEAVPKYRLVRRVKEFKDRGDSRLWAAIRSFNTRALYPEQPARPYHFEVMFHPYPKKGKTSAWLTTMWKVPADGVPPSHGMPVAPAIASDTMGLIAKVAGALEPIVPSGITTPVLGSIIQQQLGTVFAGADTERFPGEIFGSTNLPAGTGASTEIVFDHRQTEKVVALVWKVLEERGRKGEHLLGGMSLRFVPASRAHLAMNISKMSCYIEFPSVNSKGTRAVYKAIWDGLEAATIPYTCHWGQLHAMSPARLRNYFGGNRIKAWKSARDSLLDAKGKAVFSAPILAEVGLD